MSVLSLGLYPPEVVEELKSRFRDAGFYGKEEGGLRHSDSVDKVGKRTLRSTKQVKNLTCLTRGISMRLGVTALGRRLGV